MIIIPLTSFIKTGMIDKSLLKRGRILKKYTISRKQTLTLASVILGTVITGTTIASADDVAPSTTQAAPVATTAAKSLLQPKKSTPKPIHPLCLLIKQKLGMLSLWMSKKQDQLRKQMVRIQPLLQQQPSKRLA